ncbi:MAG TPA: 30S ribosomal protein S11 [Patescibacteria group bacterium]|nr:30S ribosomal protein S11 [Patescibacteria group bacterium]
MAVTKSRGKKKVAQQVPHGHAHVHASYNNTILTITDLNGNTLAWSSSGHMGFKGPKKSTPFAASQVAEDVAKKAAAYGVKEVNVFINGIGSGRDSAVRTLHAAGISILSVKDITPVPHNGCRPPKPRRL